MQVLKLSFIYASEMFGFCMVSKHALIWDLRHFYFVSNFERLTKKYSLRISWLGI